MTQPLVFLRQQSVLHSCQLRATVLSDNKLRIKVEIENQSKDRN